MSDILARYGPYFLYTYTVVLGLGLVLALVMTAALARRQAAVAWPDGALVAAAGALLLGRVVFVWLNAEYFSENPAEAWQLQLGGLNYHGALLGGLAALGLWARLTGRSFYRYAGLFAPGLALLVAGGWAACGFEGCAYGRVVAPGDGVAGILAGNLPDNLGVFALRYRTQAVGLLMSLVVFMAAFRAYGRVPPARLFWATLAGLSLVRVVVALGRGDPAPVVGGWRLDLLVDLSLLGVGLIAAYRARGNANHG